MTQAELEKLVQRLRAQRDDDARVEAKACGTSLSKDVWESVSAFANTSGGLLLLGLDERHGFVPARGFDFARVRDQFVSGIGDGGADNALLANPPHYHLERFDVGGSQILAVTIRENDVQQKPCYILRRGMQGGSYKRVDDKDIRLSPAEVFELQGLLVPSDADRSIVASATLDDLDMGSVQGFCEELRRQNSRSLRGAESPREQRRRLGIETDAGISMTAVLCFGCYPQQFFPRLVVDVSVHMGTAKASQGVPRFLDREICEGTVFECIEDGVLAVMRNLRSASVISGMGRTQVPEMPEEVIREALANAVLHREYSPYFIGQPVSVDVYEDRIEIANPGGLWGGKTIDTIDDGITRCRNQLLMKLAQQVSRGSDHHYLAEAQGSGIIMMKEELRAAGLRPPHFDARFDQFVVTLYRRGHAPVFESDMRSLRLSQRSSSADAILRSLSESEPRSVRDISRHTGLSLAAIRAQLKGLVDDGVVIATAPPTSKNRQYLLAGPLGTTSLEWEMRG